MVAWWWLFPAALVGLAVGLLVEWWQHANTWRDGEACGFKLGYTKGLKDAKKDALAATAQRIRRPST